MKPPLSCWYPPEQCHKGVSFPNNFTTVARGKAGPWQARNLLVPGSESSPPNLFVPLIQTCGLCSHSFSQFWASLACYLKLLAFASPVFDKLSTSTNCTWLKNSKFKVSVYKKSMHVLNSVSQLSYCVLNSVWQISLKYCKRCPFLNWNNMQMRSRLQVQSLKATGHSRGSQLDLPAHRPLPSPHQISKHQWRLK